MATKKKLKKATQATTSTHVKSGPISEKTDYRLFNTTTMVKPAGKRSISGRKGMVGKVTKHKGTHNVTKRFAKSFTKR